MDQTPQASEQDEKTMSNDEIIHEIVRRFVYATEGNNGEGCAGIYSNF